LKLIYILFSLFLWIGAAAEESNFVCPDQHSIELLNSAQNSQSDSGYEMVIEQAVKRSMDDVALRIACASLARRTFRRNCSDYGYECPHPGSNPMEWPAQINDWVPQLKANVQALKHCPDGYIRGDPKLPIIRFVPVIPRDVVENKITGWVAVRLDIDDSGSVTDAIVESSSSSQLEESALEAARRFRYQPDLKDGIRVASTNVLSTVRFTYLDLARAAGCSIGDD
jgi:TonB family protein